MRIAGALIAIAAVLAGCGERQETIPARPAGAFAAALATVDGPTETASTGVGWLDQAALADAGGDQGSIGDALAPNASAVLAASPRLARRFGFDPRRARRLLSVGGSYAFGLRLDGLDGNGVEAALLHAGGHSRRVGPLTLLDIGGYASVPQPLLDAGVRGLGAHDAFAPDRTVLAISVTARAALLGGATPLIDSPAYAATADCLGDVVAARLIPAKLVRSTELGIDLVALGVERPDAGARPDREVICLIGSSPDAADAIAAALESALAPGAADPVTDEPIDKSVAAAEVTRYADRGLELVRARLELAPARAPGFVYEAYARGSVTAYLGFGAPHPGGPVSG
jgi:hypothetical protein